MCTIRVFRTSYHLHSRLLLDYSQDIETVSPITTYHHAVSNSEDRATSKTTTFKRLIALFVVVAVGSTYYIVSRTIRSKPVMMDGTPITDDPMFDHLGRYVMHNFDQKKPMANFLSGLSGFWGVPMVYIYPYTTVFMITF